MRSSLVIQDARYEAEFNKTGVNLRDRLPWCWRSDALINYFIRGEASDRKIPLLVLI